MFLAIQRPYGAPRVKVRSDCAGVVQAPPAADVNHTGVSMLLAISLSRVAFCTEAGVLLAGRIRALLHCCPCIRRRKTRGGGGVEESVRIRRRCARLSSTRVLVSAVKANTSDPQKRPHTCISTELRLTDCLAYTQCKSIGCLIH